MTREQLNLFRQWVRKEAEYVVAQEEINKLHNPDIWETPKEAEADIAFYELCASLGIEPK